MTVLDFVLGRPLASEEDKDERVGSLPGVSVFGLDALSSAAYGPEAALTVLIPLGIAGLGFSLPITLRKCEPRLLVSGLGLLGSLSTASVVQTLLVGRVIGKRNDGGITPTTVKLWSRRRTTF